MLGVVNLDKPVGPTSHDMVSLLRRLTGTRRIGHAGTLDPLASGVLPILVGAATRFSQDLTHGPKRYLATIRLGVRSETDDGQGPLVATGAPLPDPPTLDTSLAGFVGTFEQRPPTFSARKQGGQRAHRAARAGTPLDLPPRLVTIERMDLVDTTVGDGWLDVRIDVRCGPGTYVRSLARDLGERLGCGGYLSALRRTEAAGLRIEDAHRPEQLEALSGAGRLGEAILAVADLLPLPRLGLAPDDADRFRHGSTIPIGPATAPGRHVVLLGDELLGIGEVVAGILRPEKVVAAAGVAS